MWIRQVFLVVLATVLANVLSHFLLRYAGKITGQTSSPWDDALIRAAKRPLPIAISVIGISFAAGIIDRHGAQIAFPTQTLHIEEAAPLAEKGGAGINS